MFEQYFKIFLQVLLTLSQMTNFRLKEFADDNFKFVENGGKLSEQIENTVTSNFSFFHSVFKRLVLPTHKNQGLFGKGLT